MTAPRCRDRLFYCLVVAGSVLVTSPYFRAQSSFNAAVEQRITAALDPTDLDLRKPG